MNKRGQVFILALMLGITLLFIGLAVAPSINVSIDGGRVSADCNNASIDTSQKVLCGVLDVGKPFIFLFIILLAGGLLGARVQ